MSIPGSAHRLGMNPQALYRKAHQWPYPYLAPLLILLLAVYARFHHLDGQSLWNDEGNSLRLAQRSVSDLIDAAGRDIHPPGYYLGLKAWIEVAGESEFSLRALSALEGVLTVAVTMALGRALFSRGTGWIAGLLVALSPFAIYYSQETRMYAQLGLLSAASMWVFVLWWRRSLPHPPAPSPFDGEGENGKSAPLPQVPSPLMGGGVKLALALALCNAAGLYTQYSFPFTMIAQGVMLAALAVGAIHESPPRKRIALQYLALNALTLALFLPWLPTAWDQITTWPRAGVDLALDQQLRTVLTWIIYGNTAGGVVWLAFLWPGLLIAAALWPGPGARRWSQGWRVALPLIWAGIVIGALFVSGAYREANLKFLLPAQVAVALLIGRGTLALWAKTDSLPPSPVDSEGEARRGPMGRLMGGTKALYIRRMLALVCLFLVAIGQVNALDALYTDPAYARADYRAIAARLLADPRPGDAIILDAPNQVEVFTYYYDGDAPIHALPRGLGGDDAQARAEVLAVIADHPRIFALFWGETERDPNRVVQATLDENAYPVDSAWHGDVRLAQYAVLGAAPAEPQTLTDARFGDHITLTGYALSADDLQPGEALGVTLFWTTDAPLATRYKVTVQLLAPDGSLVYQHDAEPGGNRALTTTWEPGATIIDTHGLIVPPDLAPGDYTIIVGLYNLDAPMDRLPVAADGAAAGDAFALAVMKKP